MNPIIQHKIEALMMLAIGMCILHFTMFNLQDRFLWVGYELLVLLALSFGGYWYAIAQMMEGVEK